MTRVVHLSRLDLSMTQLAITVLSLLLLLFALCLHLNESKPLNSDETWLNSIGSSSTLEVRSISRPVQSETHQWTYEHFLYCPRMRSIDYWYLMNLWTQIWSDTNEVNQFIPRAANRWRMFSEFRLLSLCSENTKPISQVVMLVIHPRSFSVIFAHVDHALQIKTTVSTKKTCLSIEVNYSFRIESEKQSMKFSQRIILGPAAGWILLDGSAPSLLCPCVFARLRSGGLSGVSAHKNDFVSRLTREACKELFKVITSEKRSRDNDPIGIMRDLLKNVSEVLARPISCRSAHSSHYRHSWLAWCSHDTSQCLQNRPKSCPDSILLPLPLSNRRIWAFKVNTDESSEMRSRILT